MYNVYKTVFVLDVFYVLLPERKKIYSSVCWESWKMQGWNLNSPTLLGICSQLNRHMASWLHGLEPKTNRKQWRLK